MSTPPLKRAAAPVRKAVVDTRQPLGEASLAELESMLQPTGFSDRRLFTILYGWQGTGKTSLAAKMGFHNLLISTEPGHSVISAEIDPELHSRTQVVDFNPRKGISQMMAILRAVNNEQLFVNGAPVDHIILDNFSTIVEHYINRSLREKTFKREDPDIPSYQDYLAVYRILKEPLMEFGRCMKNVTFICTPRVPDQDAIKKGETTRGEMPRKVWDALNENTNVVGMTKVKDPDKSRVEYTIQLIGDQYTTVKERLGIRKSEMRQDDFVEFIHEYLSK